MIDQCFLHCQGIGPKSEQVLKKKGFNSWGDCLEKADGIPFSGKRLSTLVETINASVTALKEDDIRYFIENFPISQHWRVLGRYFDRASFFDIETTGLSWHYSHTSVIVVYHRGKVHSFVYGENMDDFLDLIDDVDLLVSFNGNCFDIPFLEKTFNIPLDDIPHIDLRWVAYHGGYSGGLKSIEKEMDIERPAELRGIDGYEAVDLYYKWQAGDNDAREKLIKYCQADVLSLSIISQRVLQGYGISCSKIDPADIYKLIESE